jgi:hypothetical protein
MTLPTGVVLQGAAVSMRGELNQKGGATPALQPSHEPVIERAPPPVPAHREPAEPAPIDEGAVARPRPADPAALLTRTSALLSRQTHDDYPAAEPVESREAPAGVERIHRATGFGSVLMQRAPVAAGCQFSRGTRAFCPAISNRCLAPIRRLGNLPAAKN